MNDSLRVLTFGMMALLAFAWIGAAWGQDGAPAEDPGYGDAAGEAAELTPSLAAALPYDGYGSVAILDDGILLITLGGEIVAEDRDPTDSATYLGQLDTSGLTLVEHDGEVFLDKNGVHIAARGLSPEQMTRQGFQDAAALEPDTPRQALVEIRGDLDLSYNSVTGDLTVAGTGMEDPRRKLRFTVRVGDTPGGGGDGQDPVCASSSSGDGLTPGETPIWLNQPSEMSSACSVSCKHGDCTITCNSTGCKTYCSSGQPVCICTNKIQA